MKKYYISILFSCFLVFLFSGIHVSAAVLYMEPSEGEYGLGSEMPVDIFINVENDCVNTVEAFIEYPSDYMKLNNFLIGESIINLWLEKPNKESLVETNKKGILHFSGGIPGGYCGRIPGDPGQSNLLGRMIFKIPTFILSDNQLSELKLDFLDKTRVLLNDGFGTEDFLLTEGAKFKFANKVIKTEEDWESQITEDTIPPEPFIIELHQNSDIFDGQCYAIFSTIDKQSGLDHFEILEIKPEEEIGRQPKKSFWEKLFKKEKELPGWKIAEMPYLLNDQSLESIIKVSAIDQAGNERIVEYIPSIETKKQVEKTISKSLIIILVISFVVIFIILFIIFRKKDKKYEEE